MDLFLLNFLDVDATSLQVMTLMCLAGIFLVQQTTEKTAASLLFFPVFILCALSVRSAGLPVGVRWGLEEGEYIVFTTTIGMCLGLGLFALFARATRTAS
jgi:hypothetical protein